MSNNFSCQFYIRAPILQADIIERGSGHYSRVRMANNAASTIRQLQELCAQAFIGVICGAPNNEAPSTATSKLIVFARSLASSLREDELANSS